VNDDAIAGGCICTLGVAVSLVTGAVQAATAVAAHNVAMRKKLDQKDPVG